MNLDHLQATYFLQKFAWLLRDAHYDFDAAQIAIMPPYTDLRSAQVLIESEKLRLSLGAQNVSEISQGAFTGDISAEMLVKLGCSYVIVGHSERRRYHPEDDANLVDKVRAVLAAGMHPILCVGESREERRKGIELDYAVGQVHDVVRDLSDEDAANMLIAYEPVWAIGKGNSATPKDAQDAALAIRTSLARLYSQDVADRVRILYGGSANPSNALSLLEEPDVDGLLVGGASLDSEQFSQICRIAALVSRRRQKAEASRLRRAKAAGAVAGDGEAGDIASDGSDDASDYSDDATTVSDAIHARVQGQVKSVQHQVKKMKDRFGL